MMKKNQFNFKSFLSLIKTAKQIFSYMKVIITRTGIFVIVYSLVLGIPFFLAFGLQSTLIALAGEKWWWMIPLVTSTLLATIGPYLYLHIQKRAEDQLLRDQRRYQSTLRKASLGMGRIKDLKRLLNLIVHIVLKAVRIRHCSIYLFHDASQQYVLKAAKTSYLVEQKVSVFPLDSPVIYLLKKLKEPLVFEKIEQQAKITRGSVYNKAYSIMKELGAELIIPSFIEERLLAVIIMGRKRSGEFYTQDDLVVFSILANQSALAIENAQFYDDMQRTQGQLFKAEKMATIGTMADGLSHQINNRLHAMGFIAGDAIDTIRMIKKNPELIAKEGIVASLENALIRIEDNVKRGGEIVEGLLKYTRKGDQGFTSIELDKLLNASLEMIQFKVKLSEFKIERDFSSKVPTFRGNFTQLQEVFFNLIDNAYDAMMQRREDFREENYAPLLSISAKKKGKKLEVVFEDNGIGVKLEDVSKLFTPFFTTKLSSKKGTGLGLYVIRQLIEENHKGKVSFSSHYRQGTRISLLLPISYQFEMEGLVRLESKFNPLKP